MRLFTSSMHLSDEALLLLHESALSRRQALRAAKHLTVCAACTARSAGLLEQDGALWGSGAGVQPIHNAERIRLQSRLALEAHRHPSKRWFELLTEWRMVVRAGVAMLLVLAIAGLRQRPLSVDSREMGPRPNPKLTPGSVSATSVATLCSRNDRDLDPHLPAEKISAVYRAYGVNTRAAAAYQVDYLISPQLGGNDAMSNLWPEPYDATVWNAAAKDGLERHLFGMVCSGELDLAVAQRELAADWIGAYQRYFRTRRPLPAMASVKEP